MTSSTPQKTSKTVKNVLVTGATGRQGRALIRALRLTSNGTEPLHFRILALTRTPASAIAKDLCSENHVTIVEGDLSDSESIRKIFEDAKASGGIWGVFCVLAFPGLGVNADGEEQQGRVRENRPSKLSGSSLGRIWQTSHLSLEYLCLFFHLLSVEVRSMTTSSSLTGLPK
jgi:NAD(P)-dependent dehydrogenase (short-subunit alcohol dehydrogenase family)